MPYWEEGFGTGEDKKKMKTVKNPSTIKEQLIDVLESVLFTIEEGWADCKHCGGKNVMLKDLPVDQIRKVLDKAK